MTQQLIISQHYYNTLTAWARPAHPAIDSVHENSSYTRQSVLGRGPRGRNTVARERDGVGVSLLSPYDFFIGHICGQ